MVAVAVVGGTGYAGAELLRWLVFHPEAEVVCVGSRSHAGARLGDVLPGFAGTAGLSNLVLAAPDVENLAASGCEVVFTATPAGVAMELAQPLLDSGIKLIDLGTDFRFRRADVFSQWYGMKHTAAHLLDQAVYGLPEIYRKTIRGARLVGNPGCYPTSVVLGLAPALSQGLVELEDIVVFSASGVSGAGAAPSPLHHFPERFENFQAYKVASHRHTPEIEQELSGLVPGGDQVQIAFIPHLVPMSRGILSTITARVRPGVGAEELQEAYREYYRDEPFVRVLKPGEMPETKHVRGSNYCAIGTVVDPRTGRVVILSAIDNLCKGAASQAVQNMNLMLGLEETAGLTLPPVIP